VFGKRKSAEPAALKQNLDPSVKMAAIILVVGSLAPLLDSTMVNVAINAIRVDLSSTVSVIQWAITGYVLAMGISIPLSGWAGSRFGAKRVYTFSLLLFLVGSILSSLSWNIESLIVFRVIQGFGAGLMLPIVQTVLVQLSGGKNLGQLMSYVSVPAVLGPILGPVLGGMIVNSLGWRWIFYVNIPVSLIGVLLAWKGLPADQRSEQKASLDWIGLFMLSPALSILLYGIVQISFTGGIASSAVLVPLLIGAALMIAFVIYALKMKGSPVLDLHLFRSTNFSASCVLLFLSGIISTGAMLILPLFYQQVRGESVLYAGLLLIPQGLGLLVSRTQFVKLMDRIGSRPVVLTSIIMIVVGTLPFVFADANTGQVLLAVALFVRGAGLGGILIPIMTSAYVGLDKKQIPDASTATRILMTIGGAFGSAILATVLESQLTVQAVANAYNVAFGWSIGFTVLAIIPALLLSTREKAPQATAPRTDGAIK
jgi:EmrB/QacA subfamily drug resistance transporter